MLPLTVPDHSSPHSPSPSANNNLPVRLSAKNTSFLHSGNPSTPKHSVESYPYPKTSKFHTISSRNFSVFIKSSTKNSENIFFHSISKLRTSQQTHADSPSGRIQPSPRPPTHSPLPHTTISRRSALRADPAPPPVLQPQDLAPASWHLPRRRAHWHRRHADDARVGGSGVRMTDGHPGRKSRGSETGNHQISCRIASVPQSTASHTSSSARRCHRARLCGRCHGAGVRSVPHTQIEQPTPHRLLHKSSFDGS